MLLIIILVMYELKFDTLIIFELIMCFNVKVDLKKKERERGEPVFSCSDMFTSSHYVSCSDI